MFQGNQLFYFMILCRGIHVTKKIICVLLFDVSYYIPPLSVFEKSIATPLEFEVPLANMASPPYSDFQIC